MLKNEVFPYYRTCTEELEKVYSYLKRQFSDTYVEDLAKLRGYFDKEQLDLIRNMKLGCCEVTDAEELGSMRRELGLVSSKDNFLLGGRYIIPVEAMNGDLVAFIGYYPDYKKYITTPSPFFSKECMFFNFKQAFELSWKEYNGFVILVEGIFDCLSLRAIGLPVIATMGASVSKIKGDILKFFNKVLAIPDDDATGRAALDRYSTRGWNVPSSTTFLKFVGGTINVNGTKLHCKDMDNFVSWYNADDVRESLLQFSSSKEDIEELIL